MANNRLLKETSLATIDAANTIIRNYPDFQNTNTDRSISLVQLDGDPFSFIIDLIKHTEGYDVLLNIISSLLVVAIEPMELAVKTLIISHLNNFLSCSINPIITEELLREGISFEMNGLDLLNMFDVCPLDEEIGSHFYYGIKKDGSEIPDDLNRSRDFNALLWYMRNRSIGRQVWYGSTRQNRLCNQVNKTTNEKLKKKDGIITLEYGEFYQTMEDAVGGACYTQSPMRDCIHVFLGNAAPYNKETLTTRLSEINDEINRLNRKYIAQEQVIAKREEELNKLDENIGTIGADEYNDQYSSITNEIIIANLQKDIIQTDIDKQVEERAEAENAYRNETPSYREIEQNYYYRKTLMQFNTDLVMSMSLFDSKVIVAQILENLTGHVSMSLDLNYSRRVIQDEIKRMVRDIVETDETVVSDCFFSFSNDSYDSMLRKAELQRAGVYSGDGQITSNVQIDADSILSMLNNVSEDSTQEEQISTFTSVFSAISEGLATTEGGVEDTYNLGIRSNILEELLTQLAISFCMSIVTPKLYMVTAINLKIMGRSIDFNLREFIEMYRQLLTDLIRAVRDMIIRYCVSYLKKLLLKLAQEVGIKLTREQVEFYYSLLMQCIACYNLFKNRDAIDWNMGAVTADIIPEESEEPKNTGC